MTCLETWVLDECRVCETDEQLFAQWYCSSSGIISKNSYYYLDTNAGFMNVNII